ncbi:MAG: 50S ribosomal protein L6 [Deltaproteobacteria bacterium]|nr:MAG: 50S ribosomal protein L6 [Deltaproteobacteria bacterium]
MSRVGKKPINIPEKTTITWKDRLLAVKGPNGTLSRNIHPSVDLEIKPEVIQVCIDKPTRQNRAMQGLTRSLINNMVIGVNKGFERVLEINGIGYRATISGQTLNLNLGFSNSVDFILPEGISATVDKKNNITVTGIDKEKVGHVAAAIRRLRPPEPYKGKGIKYAEERIQRKAGKTGATQ